VGTVGVKAVVGSDGKAGNDGAVGAVGTESVAAASASRRLAPRRVEDRGTRGAAHEGSSVLAQRTLIGGAGSKGVAARPLMQIEAVRCGP